MRRFRDVCLLLALFGLTGSARAQYYPAPQPYYPPYARPTYYPATPTYLPGYYATPRPPAPTAVEAERVSQTPEPPQPEVAPPEQVPAEPETLLPEEPAISAGARATGLPPVRYTIPEIFASFPYETPQPGNLIWGKAEYLMWRMRDGPPHYPLVTTDSVPGTINSGTLTSPTATTLFGNDGFDYGIFHGGRLTLGLWLDPEQRFGIEGSGFLQETRTVSFHAGSDTLPSLYIPAYNILRGTEAALAVADPILGLTGTVDIAAAMQLWGAEVNGVYRLMRTGGWDVQLLTGFRYLDLLESIELQNTTQGFNQTAYLLDRFQTRNQFYGPQAGVRSDFTYGRFSAGLSAKIALGVTHEVTEVAGYNSAPTTGSLPGGFFTQQTNLGHTNLNSFSAAPQFTATLGFNLTERVMLFASYDYLLWTNVARAGDQIDRVLNLSQSAAFGVGGLTNILGRPEPLFNRSDFWAQGISLGVQYRY
jgi:hypothetical protein